MVILFLYLLLSNSQPLRKYSLNISSNSRSILRQFLARRYRPTYTMMVFWQIDNMVIWLKLERHEGLVQCYYLYWFSNASFKNKVGLISATTTIFTVELPMWIIITLSMSNFTRYGTGDLLEQLDSIDTVQIKSFKGAIYSIVLNYDWRSVRIVLSGSCMQSQSLANVIKMNSALRQHFQQITLPAIISYHVDIGQEKKSYRCARSHYNYLIMYCGKY